MKFRAKRFDMPDGSVRILAPDVPEAPPVPRERGSSPRAFEPRRAPSAVGTDEVARALGDVDRYVAAATADLGVAVSRELVLAWLALEWGSSVARGILRDHREAQDAVLRADAERDRAVELYRASTVELERRRYEKRAHDAVARGAAVHGRLRRTLDAFLWLSRWWPSFEREWRPVYEREHGALLRTLERRRASSRTYWQERAELERAGVA